MVSPEPNCFTVHSSRVSGPALRSVFLLFLQGRILSFLGSERSISRYLVSFAPAMDVEPRRRLGVVVHRCGHERFFELVNQRRYQCAKCRHQISISHCWGVPIARSARHTADFVPLRNSDRRGWLPRQTELALQKQGGYATLVGGHQIHRREPTGQRNLRPVKNDPACQWHLLRSEQGPTPGLPQRIRPFGATVARRRQPHFGPSLVSEPAADQPSTSRFGEQGISIQTYWAC